MGTIALSRAPTLPRFGLLIGMAAVAVASIPDAQNTHVNLTVSFANNATCFQVGEIIPVEKSKQL